MPKQMKQRETLRFETPQAKATFNALSIQIEEDLNSIAIAMSKESMANSILLAHLAQIKLQMVGEAIRIAQDVDLKWKSFHLIQEKTDKTIH